MGYLFFAFIICLIFQKIESYHFIQYDGEMIRGIKIDSEFLSAETIHYLRNLQSDIVEVETKAFIRKENQIVLIQPISHLFQGNLGFRYIGLVDLSERRPQIAYHVSLLDIIVIIILASILIYNLFTGNSDKAISTISILIFLPIFYTVAHPFSKKVVKKYLEKTMQTKSG
jgi:hypothetical protein